MTARILVVDDVKVNIDLLTSRLERDYFEVFAATNGAEALSVLDNEPIDLMLLDIMMPGIDGFEVCKRVKENPALAHIPIVMVTALDQMADRVRGLEAGADDFLTKPVNEMQLMSRVKSLVRLKMLTDELRLRANTTRDIALRELLGTKGDAENQMPEVLIVDHRQAAVDKLVMAIGKHARSQHVTDARDALAAAAQGNHDCVIVAAELPDYDPLRFISQMRSNNHTRYLPVVLSVDTEDNNLIARALELGVNDYMVRPVDPNEFLARLNTQIRRKRYHDGLRANLAESIELAVTDGLTGLHNRRYLDTHLKTLVERAVNRQRPLSLLITDIDHFKRVNDTYGHEAGDDVLREFARRLRSSVRGIDLACRYGGEEFVIVMPDTSAILAQDVAERLREQVAGDPFKFSDGRAIELTTSIGVATLSAADGSDPAALLRKADQALYAAKQAGRNQVIADAA
ncbi:MAG: PleD family two-component system response regulator [Pseudomonadota bacterium]